MTEEEFDLHEWSKGAKCKYRGVEFTVTQIDFVEMSVYIENKYQIYNRWVHCKDIELIDKQKQKNGL